MLSQYLAKLREAVFGKVQEDLGSTTDNLPQAVDAVADRVLSEVEAAAEAGAKKIIRNLSTAVEAGLKRAFAESADATPATVATKGKREPKAKAKRAKPAAHRNRLLEPSTNGQA